MHMRFGVFFFPTLLFHSIHPIYLAQKRISLGFFIIDRIVPFTCFKATSTWEFPGRTRPHEYNHPTSSPTNWSKLCARLYSNKLTCLPHPLWLLSTWPSPLPLLRYIATSYHDAHFPRCAKTDAITHDIRAVPACPGPGIVSSEFPCV